MMFKTKGNKTDCSMSEVINCMFVVTCFLYCSFCWFFQKILNLINTLNSVIIGITISHFILMLYYVKYNTQWFETRFIHLVVLYTCTFIISMIFNTKFVPIYKIWKICIKIKKIYISIFLSKFTIVLVLYII